MFSESLKISKQKFRFKYWGFGIRKFGCFDEVSKIIEQMCRSEYVSNKRVGVNVYLSNKC